MVKDTRYSRWAPAGAWYGAGSVCGASFFCASLPPLARARFSFCPLQALLRPSSGKPSPGAKIAPPPGYAAKGAALAYRLPLRLSARRFRAPPLSRGGVAATPQLKPRHSPPALLCWVSVCVASACLPLFRLSGRGFSLPSARKRGQDLGATAPNPHDLFHGMPLCLEPHQWSGSILQRAQNLHPFPIDTAHFLA